ncbi:MAG TPA: response regulator, partial [Planctomycetota bacterium]|nr:response regulator [Planctomycetota bacterium]
MSPFMKDPIHVLLVEDSVADARLVREYLAEERDGEFRVDHVTALAQVADASRGRSPDVVLLDLGVDDSDGLLTLDRVRSVMGGDVPVVVLTGVDDDGVALRAVRAGAEDFLVKGEVDGVRLGRCIRQAVARHRRRPNEESAEPQGGVRSPDLEALVAASPDGMAVVDADGVLLFANRAAFEALGLKAADGAGARFPAPFKAGHSVEVELGGDRCVETRAAATRWRGAPATVVTLRDTAARRRAERRLLAVERRWRALYASEHEGLAVVEGDGRVVAANAAAHRRLGGGDETLIGERIERRIPGFRGAQPPGAPARGAVFLESSVRCAQGADACVDVVAAPMAPEGGGASSWVLAVRDAGPRVAHRRELAERHRRAIAAARQWRDACEAGDPAAFATRLAASAADALSAAFAGVADVDVASGGVTW